MTEPTTDIAAVDHIDKALKGELLDGIVQPSGYTAMRGAASYLQDLGINDGITRDVLANNHTVTQAEFDATKQWKADHLADREWTDKYMSGDLEAKRKMTLANIILTGGIKGAPAA